MIITNTNQRVKKAYYAINADCMLKYWKDREYHQIINEKENVIYVDGMGVIYAQKFLKLSYAEERIATTDLFPALMDYLNIHKSSLKIFLLGGENDTAERVRNNFMKKYPQAQIVGTHHGYFNKVEESHRIINSINSLNIDILFVGFGNPAQEKWVHQYFGQLEVSTIITCGGLFDYYSNNVKRAPIAMQKWGFEWLFRLIQEPKRLYKRYIWGNLNYLVRVLWMKLKRATAD